MKRQYRILTLILVCGIFACSKEKGLNNPSGGNNTGNDVPKSSHPNLESFFAAIAEKPEKFTKDATQLIQITTTEGTVFTIPGNVLVDMMGNPVSGNVEVEIAEFNKPEAMILGNVGTVLADGGLLESGGMYDIKVSKNGQPVRLKDGAVFEVEFPGNQPDMTAFIGTEGSDGTIQWEPRPDWMMSLDSNQMKRFFPDSFSFGNLDQLAKMPNPTDLTVHLDPSQKTGDSRMWLVFSDQRMVGSLVGVNGTFETASYDVPEGAEVTLIVFSLRDGYLHWHNRTFTIKNNETIQLPAMQKVSEDDFKKKLKELNP